MRHYFITAFFFLQFLLKAQTVKLELDNIDINIGQIASDMFNSQISSVDSSSNFAKFVPSSIPILYAGRLEFIMRRQFSERRFWTLGLILKKYRYSAITCILPTCRPINTTWTFEYTTIQISHQYRFASNSFTDVFLETGLHFDYAASGKRTHLRPFSASLLAKMSCYFPINELNQIVFSPTFNLPISNYNDRNEGKAFLPFSYGVTVGYSRNVKIKKKEKS